MAADKTGKTPAQLLKEAAERAAAVRAASVAAAKSGYQTPAPAPAPAGGKR